MPIDWRKCVFMDETHKASKDFYRRRAFARGGLPAHVVMSGPINRQFSILAAMGVDGARFRTKTLNPSRLFALEPATR